jgi:hypothetical protein
MGDERMVNIAFDLLRVCEAVDAAQRLTTLIIVR